MGKKKGKKRVSFGGGIWAHLALFFSPACLGSSYGVEIRMY